MVMVMWFVKLRAHKQKVTALETVSLLAHVPTHLSAELVHQSLNLGYAEKIILCTWLKYSRPFLV